MTALSVSGRGSREPWLVAALTALAGLRVLALAAAFPFFTNVDEHKHVDMVLKYARGYLPRPDADAFEARTGEWIGLYGSPEYHLEAERARTAGVPPPAWARSGPALAESVERQSDYLAQRANKEAHGPPLYYACGAAWLQLGRLLGLDGAHLLYWIRWLSALASAASVALSYHFLRALYPDAAHLRLGVPALLAAFPLDALWYVTRDALSPLLGALGFFLALGLLRARHPSPLRFAGTGALAGLAFLAKYTNVLLAVPLGLASLGLLRRGERAGGRLVALWAAALLPPSLWLLRNLHVLGDATGSRLKVQRLGWTPSPVEAWLEHPLFTPAGLPQLVGGLLPKLWRGELVWYREVLALPGADLFFTATSLLCLGLAAAAQVRPDPSRADAARDCERSALWMLMAAVVLLAFLSLLYRFPETGNPSASRPWFDHGRLIGCVLVPFLVLYVRGLEVAAGALPAAIRAPAIWGGLGLVIAVALLSELWLTLPVFGSAYNWYHLP